MAKVDIEVSVKHPVSGLPMTAKVTSYCQTDYSVNVGPEVEYTLWQNGQEISDWESWDDVMNDAVYEAVVEETEAVYWSGYVNEGLDD